MYNDKCEMGSVKSAEVSPFFSFSDLPMLEGRDKGWTGQSASQNSIVAAIHVAVLGLLESADASGDLRMSSEPGKTAVARNALCFPDHPVLYAAGASEQMILKVTETE
jgi:hypothetical protein